MIRVTCNTCHSASEVDDAAAGAQAVCPFCSNVFDVPARPEPPLPVNPYASSSSQTPRRRPLTDTAIEWGTLDPKTCCQIAAELYRRHMLALLIGHIPLSIGFLWFGQFLVEPTITNGSSLVLMLAWLVLLLIHAGLSLKAFRLARNEESDAETILAGRGRYLRFVAFHLLLGLLITIGCIGFIVPGIYFATRFWAGGLFILDQNCALFEAFGLASQFSEKNRLPSLMLGLISFGLTIIGLSLYGVGLIFVAPFLTLMWVVAYLMLTRQPIERPVPFAA